MGLGRDGEMHESNSAQIRNWKADCLCKIIYRIRCINTHNSSSNGNNNQKRRNEENKMRITNIIFNDTIYTIQQIHYMPSKSHQPTDQPTNQPVSRLFYHHIIRVSKYQVMFGSTDAVVVFVLLYKHARESHEWIICCCCCCCWELDWVQ